MVEEAREKIALTLDFVENKRSGKLEEKNEKLLLIPIVVER